MSRKYFKTVLFLVVLLAVSAQANELTNGNFNTGDFTGWWTWVPDPLTQSITIETTYTFDGTANAKMASAGDSQWQEMGQSFDCTANTLYDLSFVYDAPQWSQAGVNINFVDASWAWLGNVWISLAPPNTTGWTSYSGSFTTVAGAAYAEVKFVEGSWGNMYVDNVVVTPEPATMLLLGLGGLALRRRKRT